MGGARRTSDFFVTAPGYRKLTTQINIDGDEYLHDDFAFATRDGLIPEVHRSTDPAEGVLKGGPRVRIPGRRRRSPKPWPMPFINVIGAHHTVRCIASPKLWRKRAGLDLAGQGVTGGSVRFLASGLGWLEQD